MPTEPDEIVVDCTDPATSAAWWARLLEWEVRGLDDGDVLVAPPAGEPGIPLLFGVVPDPDAGTHRSHLDLRSRTADEQATLVRRAEEAGARRIDVGQGDVPWVVLADPDGVRFCVLEPRPEYDGAGSLAAVVTQSTDPSGSARFWASATGWGVTASEAAFASVRAPGGVGPAIEFVTADDVPDGKGRLHVDVRPRPGDTRDGEVARLTGLGARPADVGQSDADPWVVLADPDGAIFCVLGD
jgi:Glyoxalase-like domain